MLAKRVRLYLTNSETRHVPGVLTLSNNTEFFSNVGTGVSPQQIVQLGMGRANETVRFGKILENRRSVTARHVFQKSRKSFGLRDY